MEPFVNTVEVSEFYNGKTDPPSDWSKHLKYTCAVAAEPSRGNNMEDRHALVAPFNGVHGQGFFAVFDGHGGRSSADYCGANFRECFQKKMDSNPTSSVGEIIEQTFKAVDRHLTAEAGDPEWDHSGCTAVTAFLRIENRSGEQLFFGDSSTTPGADTPIGPNLRRVLYCANVGDSRGVLCRGGKVIELTCDHNTSNGEEVKRISDKGGKVEAGKKVMGYSKITRSLGDSLHKDFIIGTPYQSTTELCDEDEFVILASDGLWKSVKDNKEAVDEVRWDKDPEAAAKKLIELVRAKRNTLGDDITVVVIRLRDPPVQEKNAGDVTTD